MQGRPEFSIPKEQLQFLIEQWFNILTILYNIIFFLLSKSDCKNLVSAVGRRHQGPLKTAKPKKKSFKTEKPKKKFDQNRNPRAKLSKPIHFQIPVIKRGVNPLRIPTIFQLVCHPFLSVI